MGDSNELNELQEATLEAISIARDQIEIQFSENARSECMVDYTLKRLFSYFSDRSQVISYLVSSNYVWDAEIILRSFYEVAAKIWFIALASHEDQEILIEEFWGKLGQSNSRKQARKAMLSSNVSARHGCETEQKIFDYLTRDDVFDFGTANKNARKTVEQKWSFSEIISYLSKNSPEDFNLTDANGLLHIYGIASHLIHGDESALNLMLDRKMRSVEEGVLLDCAQVARVFSDQTSLWTFSAIALRHHFDRKTEISTELFSKYLHVRDLTKPIHARFYETQKEFYDHVDQDSS